MYYVDRYVSYAEVIGESKSRRLSVGGLSLWPQPFWHLSYVYNISSNCINLKSMACSGATGATLDGSLVSSVQLGNGNEELLKLKIDQGAPVSITLFGTSDRVMHYPNY